MTHDEIDAHCAELHRIAGDGPGDIPAALKLAQGELLHFKSEAWRDTVKAPLVDVDTDLKSWFSATQWNKQHNDGAFIRERLHGNIERLRYAMEALIP